MSLKQTMLARGMKLMGDPRVMRLMANPRVMGLLMKAFQLRGRAQASFDERVRRVAHALNLATADEISELKQIIRGLEQQLYERSGSRPSGAR